MKNTTIPFRRLALALTFALAGCTSAQEADEATSRAQQSVEQAGEEADQRATNEAESNEANESTGSTEPVEAEEEITPEKETKMADPNAPEDVAAPPEDAKTTESGLAYKILEEGQGKSPSKTDTVRVHYTGWTTDGKKFDSSHDRGKPAEFPLNRVIAGWTEGVSMMKAGEKRRLWIPEELAYQGRPGAPQGMLVFDVELLEIVD